MLMYVYLQICIHICIYTHFMFNTCNYGQPQTHVCMHVCSMSMNVNIYMSDYIQAYDCLPIYIPKCIL